MRAEELAEDFPVVTVDSDALDAARLLAEHRLPGLVVTDGSGVTAEDLITHCRGTLAGFKCPKRVEFVAELPRTATGKLQKFKLREPFWAGRDRQVG